MKIYEFKELIVCLTAAIVIITICICATVYGINFMEGWFKVDNRLAENKIEIIKELKIDINNQIKQNIMTSCLKGQLNDGSHRK